MADVKWIKIAVNIFDNRKIKQIEKLPDGDRIIAIWLKILCLAGIVNDCGMVYLTRDIPYTEQTLATEFNRPLETIQVALNVFQRFDMISIVNDFICVSNWEKYQNTDALDRVREQTRIRTAEYRKRLSGSRDVTCDATVTLRDDTDKEEDKKKNKKESISPLPPLDEFSEPMQTAIKNWLSYKDERREKYKPTGLTQFISMTRNAVSKYGEDAVLYAFTHSMGANYQGVVWEKAQKFKAEPPDNYYERLN